MITDYTTLQQAVADWLLRGDLTAQIPTFIQLAEAKMNRDVRLRTLDSQAEDTLSTVAASDAIDLPADFHSVITMDLVGLTPGCTWPPLEYVTPTEFKRKQRENAFASGTPQYYSIIKRQLRLVPTPDSAYDIDLVYNARIPALGELDIESTNWMLDQNPDLYLYATLAESAPFLDQDERIATWEGAYDKRAEAFRVDADAQRYNGSPLKMRARTIGG